MIPKNNAKMQIPSIVKPDLNWWKKSINTAVNPIRKGVGNLHERVSFGMGCDEWREQYIWLSGR